MESVTTDFPLWFNKHGVKYKKYFLAERDKR